MNKKFIISYLTNIKNSKYLKNIATLATGTVIAQLIPILMSPILSRIYLPEDYGLFGVLISISSVIGIFSVLELSSAIIISESEEEKNNIISTGIIINLIVSIISLTVLTIFNDQIVSFFKSPNLKYLLYLIPFQIMLGGFSSLFSSSLNKTGNFRVMSRNRLFVSISTTLLSLFLGILGYHQGLIYSLILGNLLGTVLLTRFFLIEKNKMLVFRFSVFIEILIKHKKFPLFSVPSNFLSSFTNQLPVYILSQLTNLNYVGSFNYSIRMLGIPSSFISQSITEVFRKRASDDYQKNKNALHVFKNTFKLLFFLSFIPFAIIFIWGPEIFTFVFGKNWTEAGEFSRILSLMYFFKFTVSPLSYMYIITGHQKEDLIMHLLIFFFIGSSMLLGFYIYNSVTVMILFFSISYSIIYLFYFIRSYQFAHGKDKILHS